jgi:hypothetical protein
MAMSPLAQRRQLTNQPTSPFDYHRTNSLPLSVDITAMSDVQESCSDSVASTKKEDQTVDDSAMSQHERVGIHSRNKKPSRLQWLDVDHKTDEFFGDKWNDENPSKDDLLMKLTFTELHKQSLQNPNSMANITKVATL